MQSCASNGLEDPCMTVEQIEQNVVCACTIAGWANPDRAHHRKPHQHLQDIFLKKWLDKHMLIKFLTQQEGPAPSEMMYQGRDGS
eukprot:s2050_g9.t1